MQTNQKFSIPQLIKNLDVFEELKPPKDKLNSYRSAITRIHKDCKNSMQFTVRNGIVIRLKDKTNASKSNLSE